MSYNVKTHPAFAGYDLPETGQSWVSRALRNLAVWSAENRAYHNTFNELSILSDRDLADIGISRADIPAIARDAAQTMRRSH
jgi:uncharacterized protein YjiS (DUF1127 family)